MHSWEICTFFICKQYVVAETRSGAISLERGSRQPEVIHWALYVVRESPAQHGRRLIFATPRIELGIPIMATSDSGRTVFEMIMGYSATTFVTTGKAYSVIAAWIFQ
jgi:hypothetical protein